MNLPHRERRLRKALDAFLASDSGRDFDYVLIDCPPSLGLLTINAFTAAREVLIPIQCEYYALEGLSQLLSNIELIAQHLNPELAMSTILLTMYDGRTNLAQQVAAEVREHFPQQTLTTLIPRSVRISEAQLRPERHQLRPQLTWRSLLPGGSSRDRTPRSPEIMATKRTGLGRGIGALIPTSDERSRPVDVFFPDSIGAGAPSGVQGDAQGKGEPELVAVPGARLANLDPADITPNAQQPRTDFRQDELQELMVSIREYGVLQPIVVRPLGADADGRARYELVMGASSSGYQGTRAGHHPGRHQGHRRRVHAAGRPAGEPAPVGAEPPRGGQRLSAAARGLRHHTGRARPAPRAVAAADHQHDPPAPSARGRAASRRRWRAVGRACARDPVIRGRRSHASSRREDRQRGSLREGGGGCRATGQRTSKPRKSASSARNAHLDDTAQRIGDHLNTSVRVTMSAQKGQIVIDFATVGDLTRIAQEMGVPDADAS